MTAKDSSSHEQLAAERLIRDQVQTKLGGTRLEPASFTLSAGARVNVDGVSPGGSVLVEVFAHQGGLKGGQRHKIATDLLKLITIAKDVTHDPNSSSRSPTHNLRRGRLATVGTRRRSRHGTSR